MMQNFYPEMLLEGFFLSILFDVLVISERLAAVRN